MNTQAIIQLITGAVGSVAFGMLFHMKSKYLPLAGACKLRSNGMPVPLLRNGYSIFNGTKYR